MGTVIHRGPLGAAIVFPSPYVRSVRLPASAAGFGGSPKRALRARRQPDFTGAPECGHYGKVWADRATGVLLAIAHVAGLCRMEQGSHPSVRQRSKRGCNPHGKDTAKGIIRDTYGSAPSDAAGSRHHQRPDGPADGTAAAGTTRTAPTRGDARARCEGAPAHLRFLFRAGRSSNSGSLPPRTGALSQWCVALTSSGADS